MPVVHIALKVLVMRGNGTRLVDVAAGIGSNRFVSRLLPLQELGGLLWRIRSSVVALVRVAERVDRVSVIARLCASLTHFLII